MIDPQLGRHLSDGQYEFVDVTFTAANTDTVIPYSVLKPEDPNDVRWFDVTQKAVNVGGTDTLAHVYQSGLPSALAWAQGYIVLRATVAGYSTRLKLFVERT